MQIMTKTVAILLLLTGLLRPLTQAQTVASATETIDKTALPGLNVTLPIDEKWVAKAWEEQLRGYGRVSASRGVYRVTNAGIPTVSSEPVNVTSQVKGNRKSTTLFVAMDLGNQVYVNGGTPQYPAAETMLKDFANRMIYEQTVRDAEDLLAESQKNQQQNLRRGEKLQREIENNRKEKERLLKRIDENGKELEQLLKDAESNKTDQANALSDVGTKIKNVEDVKSKKKF
jgi:hypothetical protein